MKTDLLARINELKPWVVQHRRHLHQYPELSLQEQQTSAYCQSVLAELGYQIKPCFAYGFIADLDIFAATKRIAFRAEMDALPIVELNHHDFVSKHVGVAHMCGHDAHMAIALLTAKILSERQKELNCHVRFIFQPSEEELPGGAKGMIADDCLAGVDEIYGLHGIAIAEAGRILIREGVLMGTSSPFTLQIQGKGCHAAAPEQGLNPISAAAKLVQLWQEISKQWAVEYPPILSITLLQSGNTNNVIPETAKMMGALRAFSQENLNQIQQQMRESLQAFEAQGYQMELSFTRSYPCVVNQSYGVGRVLQAVHSISDLKVDQSIAPMRFVEDFAYYLEACPGAFYFLGTGNREKNIIHPLHSPHYDIDEQALVVGASVMSTLALEMP